jgi:hypothetical protein
LVRPSPHRVDITAAAIRVSDRLAGREPARLSVHGPPLAPARLWCRRRRPSRLPSAPLRSCGTEDGHGSGAARAAGIGGSPVHPALTAHRAGTGMLARDPTAADPPLFAPSVLSAMPYMRQLASATAPEVARAHRQLKAAPDSAGNGPVDLPLGCRPWCSPTTGIVVAGRPRLNRMLPRSCFARDERASPLGCLTRLTLVRSGRERGALGDACVRGSAIPGPRRRRRPRLHGAGDPVFRTISVLAWDDEDRHGRVADDP